MAKILIIDDETILAKSLLRSLTKAGYEGSIATRAEEGLKLLVEERPDLVLLDMKLEGMGGLEALRRIVDFDPSILVLIITAYGSIETAVEAMKIGAVDYLCKPLDLEALKITMARALEERRLRQRLSYYQRKDLEGAEGLQIVGESPAMKRVLSLVEKIAQLDSGAAGDLPTVLILGETGTGKDLVARAIHSRSRLADQPFVEVNCTTLPKDLLEAELFGYEKGAFTDAKASKAGLVEVADGGTLFLNEIGELPPEAQGKLLKAIEQKRVRRLGDIRERSINVRIIAATNQDLESAVRERSFRMDLLYRLKVLTIELPPLRERGNDILLLAEHFLSRHVQKYGTGPKRLSPSALAVLKGYRWPGNVRELAHVMERAVLLSEGEEIGPALLGLGAGLGSPRVCSSDLPIGEFPLEGLELKKVEQDLIQKALVLTGGNVSEAARRLGIGREALRYRMRKHAIVPLQRSG